MLPSPPLYQSFSSFDYRNEAWYTSAVVIADHSRTLHIDPLARTCSYEYDSPANPNAALHSTLACLNRL
jgi:hypothetical protein